MSNTYIGGMTAWGSIAAMQAAAEAENASPEVDECGHELDENGNVALQGETPIAAGSPVGATVPNFSPVHVTTPLQVHSLPSNLQTNPLSSGRSRGR